MAAREVVAALKRGGWYVDDIQGSHHLLHSNLPGKIPVHGNRILEPWTLKKVLNRVTMTTDEFRGLLRWEVSSMRYTVLLLPGEDPEVYVAFVPGLDVVTQGDGREGAIAAAREASILAVKDMIEGGEEILVERGDAIVATIEVDVPVPAAATA